MDPSSSRSIALIEAAFTPYINKPVHGLLGLCAMAIGKDGEIVYQGAHGERSFDQDAVRMTIDTVYWIASQTKLMTAVAALQCVERGQIALDDPVGNICPELTEPMVLEEFSDDGTPILRKAHTAITLRHLLSHTSGYVYSSNSPKVARWISSTGFKGHTMSGHLSSYELPLAFEPGTSWMYGPGLDWAGRVVERLNQCTLEIYMKQNIWDPLKMTSTTFHPETRPDLVVRRAGVALRRIDGTLIPGSPPYHYPAKDDLGGVGCYSTCEDYIKLLGALLRDGDGILTKESVDEMCNPYLTPEQNAAHREWRAVKFPEGTDINFGLSVETNLTDMPGRRAAGSFNWSGYPNMIWWVDRTTGIAATVFQQIIPPSDATAQKMCVDFEKALYAHLADKNDPDVEMM